MHVHIGSLSTAVRRVVGPLAMSLVVVASPAGAQRPEIINEANCSFGLAVERGTTSCSLGGVTMTSTASAEKGLVRAALSGSAQANIEGSGFAISYARWNDWLRVKGGTAAYVRYDFAVNGAMTPDFAQSNAWETRLLASFIYPDDRGFFDYPDDLGGFQGQPYGVEAAAVPDPMPAPTPIKDRLSSLVAIQNGLAPLTYGISLQASLVTAGVNTPALFMAADFGNTAGLTGLTFFDTDMNELSNVVYDFENGTEFYRPDGGTSVPEPASATLVVAGLVALSVTARRRPSRRALPSRP